MLTMEALVEQWAFNPADIGKMGCSSPAIQEKNETGEGGNARPVSLLSSSALAFLAEAQAEVFIVLKA